MGDVIKPGSFISGLVVMAAVTMTTSCSIGSAQAPRTSTSTVTATPSASTSSPSMSPSPSPTLPTAAREHTQVGAEAFVRYFFVTYSYAFWALDPTPMQAISARDCVFCADTSKAVGQLKDQHYLIEGGGISVNTLVVTPALPGGIIPVLVALEEEPSRTLASDGRVVDRSLKAEKVRIEVSLQWGDRGWIVRDAEVQTNGRS